MMTVSPEPRSTAASQPAPPADPVVARKRSALYADLDQIDNVIAKIRALPRRNPREEQP